MSGAAAVPSARGVALVSQRLDNLHGSKGGCGGISGYYLKLLFASGFGWAMDSMDTFLFTYCLKPIKDEFQNEYNRTFSPHELGILGSSVFAGSFVGAFLFGCLADQFGRRPVFLWTMVVFLAGMVMCGLADSYGMLLTFRFVTGIGLGGELPVASTLVQELSPKAIRGRMVVLLDGFWPVGCMFAVALAFELIKVITWRQVFFVSTAPVLIAIILRVMIPESPKWLASVGRNQDANRIIQDIEIAHGVYSYTAKLDPHVDDPTANVFSYRHLSTYQRVALLFRGEYLKRTVVLWIVWFGIAFAYYAIYVWLPVIVSSRPGAFNIYGTSTSLFVILAWQIPGYFSAAYIVEKIGRKLTLVLFLFCSFASALIFGYVEPTEVNLMCAGSFMSFSMLGAWGALYAYTPENYPTNIRAMGAAYPSGFSRISAIAGTYVIPLLHEAGWSPESVMWLNGTILMVCCVILFLFGYETRGKDIDDVLGMGNPAELHSGLSDLLSPYPDLLE
ncbi:hypothetical protein DYB25_008097 [Aphanomyces astaci]|uniref:Major facilitator superfamily (MFS) profile domain-containing protein n=3 Tax=Aphanomyces astaci TaxID=112090 RepID=A0A397BX18_APHAT|nr:hypothetical protein DYB25_008097 [Aphanomyces astaci]RHY35818.1 hypothetical protein DYB38_009113 [Aphanomyces astaci]RHY43349.1 hypothetical protein DYB34_011728 [Aphanomyces astaci]RHZ11236.1 hypothetical protein DYB31_003092 [Aphanomyces astaci]